MVDILLIDVYVLPIRTLLTLLQNKIIILKLNEIIY